MSRSREKSHEAGFTLIEAMASVAVMAAIVAALGTFSGQWLAHWRHGLVELQRADLLGLGIDRIAADVAAAEYVKENGNQDEPLFEGSPSSITFVRSAIEPGSRARLEIVQIAEVADGRGFAVVRARKPFAPSADTAPAGFVDPVVLVRAPFRVSFAYAGIDRTWIGAWKGNKRLPSAVRLTVHDSGKGHVLPESTAFPIRVTAPPQDESKTRPDSQPSALAAPTSAVQPP
jgi:general secretion pathway protein J